MLKIRLQRIGRRLDPKFRIIVTEAGRGPKTGKFIEIIGSYDAKQGAIQIKKDRAEYWLSVGAQVSDTVHNMLVTEKVVSGKKVNALPKKVAPVKEPEPTPEPAPVVESTPEPVAEATPEPVVESAPVEEEAPATPTEEAPAPEATETPAE